MRDEQGGAGSRKGGGQHGPVRGGTEAGPARARVGGLSLIVMAAALAALLGASVLTTGRHGGPAGVSGPTAAAGGTAAVGGPFHLVDQDGRPVDQRLLDGHWTAVFFGYVSCPDVCPATLQTLAAAQEKLNARGKDFRTALITVDPERDRPAQLKVYLAQPDFPHGSTGLTGTPAQVAAAAKAYRVFYQKAPRKDGGYDMDHSAAIYLMDPRGRFVEPLLESQGPQAIADQIGAAMTGERG